MADINKEYLQECFEYVDGKLFWKERPRKHFNTDRGWKIFNGRDAGKEAGSKRYYETKNVYRWAVGISGKNYKRSRLVWILHNGDIPKDMMIDHIDGNTLNDRLDNLRVVTNQVNCYNQKKYKSNSSGVTGVHWHITKKKWVSRGRIKGKLKQLYCGDDFFEAVCARKSYEVKHPHMTDRHGK